MLEIIKQNYALIILCIIAIVGGSLSGYKFAKKTKEEKEIFLEEKLEDVKKWLLYACLMAEKMYGGGTGAIKLASVYEKFVKLFPQVSELITYERFSFLVDQALVEMRELIEKNIKVKDILEDE